MTYLSPASTTEPTGGTHTTREVTTTALAVSSAPGVAYETLLRLVFPAEPSDILDITARARVTNMTEFPLVAVGYGLWIFDAELPPEDRIWTQIGPQREGSTDPVRTVLAMHTEDVYQVPAEWPEGHRMAVVYRGDAYAPDLDPEAPPVALDVDAAYGSVTIRRWLALP
ncbi:hypothetical protein [Glycomyces artemisiae]|uniref:Uncharacterized protein n=1 Tax=Glycomyces artemisiae TaxID=1076443 RepID=A0A2T0UF04_9ACTN|nr:hypothetical protein [Glycomyces artemisiae]PRY56428.1 hypothetical protein B0I28_10977 [Glycomyces artemisiae]